MIVMVLVGPTVRMIWPPIGMVAGGLVWPNSAFASTGTWFSLYWRCTICSSRCRVIPLACWKRPMIRPRIPAASGRLEFGAAGVRT